MSPHPRVLSFLLPVLLIGLTACAGLPAIGSNEEQTADVQFGPQISTTEHQTRVFETIFDHFEENYIYFESSSTDWDSLRSEYQTEIDQGLTTAEFNSLMAKFEAEFSFGEVIYVTREERIQVETGATTPANGGIGAFISFKAEEVPHVVILDVMPGSPAEKSGLRPHDSIFAVDGNAVDLDEGGNIIQKIRGEAGTTVVLTVRSPGNEERNIEITRAQLNNIGKIKASTLPGTNIGYILMPTMVSTSSLAEIVEALDEFSQSSDFAGVILDLRISNGGTDWPIEDMLALFLNDTTIDIYNRTESQPYPVIGQDLSGSQEVPIVVLVGEHTTGMPELFAAAIQSTGRGTVIGSNTAGNIEAISAYPLPNGGQILIASGSFRVSGEEEIGVNGFSPEVQIEAQWDEIQPEADPVLEQAILSLEVQK